MPRYNPATIEPKWQQFWHENRTFAASRLPEGRKMYVLDMFPYPSGDGLHVGHPEGYTATDIVCRYQRMRGTSVMHPMGWDAFGLPAEQHAKKTGTHPRSTTEKNIANFRRQLKMLGFSYDWDRELATTDLDYLRWTQFIFLLLFDTWFDEQQQRGRPIAELPIPAEVKARGEEAQRRYQDDYRLAYQIEAPVNWCPKLATVLANEEVVGGVSERGRHPVMRIPLRQWMLRITAYADRLENDLQGLDWSNSIKLLQRNWIGRSTGGEVDFFIGAQATSDGKPPTGEYQAWLDQRQAGCGFPRKPDDDVLRIFTTRPDTLFGATYMVIAPEHPFLQRLTTPDSARRVKAYCEKAAAKSDLDRTDLAKEKTGEFTGSYAINPVNGEAIPIWVADYVLISYGTGAIMAVPAHDRRDFEFAREFDLPIVPVYQPSSGWKIKGSVRGPLDIAKTVSAKRLKILSEWRHAQQSGELCFIGDEDRIELRDPEEPDPEYRDFVVEFRDPALAINSSRFDGMMISEFKQRIVDDLTAKGLGREAVNYKLRDWLFSRQHFWGEPFPILHELDENGRMTGLVRAMSPQELPLDLPIEMKFDAAHATPEPPLDAAPDDWLYVTIDGKKYKRETNSMPQWAGSCWYYLRFLDPNNDQALVDPEVERAWMPVDLYVGGAEHAVLHLLYARFWHKVLYDRGYVSMAEPFQKLVNQGMILGEMEFTGYRDQAGDWVSAAEVKTNSAGRQIHKPTRQPVTPVKIDSAEVQKQGDAFVLESDSLIKIDSRAHKMSKSRGNVVNPDEVVAEYGADSLRLYEMFMGPLESVKPWSMEGVSGVRGFLDRVWRMIVDERADAMQLNRAVRDVEPTNEQNRMLHKTIRAVSDDLDSMDFNTAIARMMEFTNFFLKENTRPKRAMKKLVLLLSPYAPHVAEELWRLLGHADTLAFEPWPEYDEAALKEETIEIPVQVMGKLRAKITLAAGVDRNGMEAAAREHPKIAELLAGKTVSKVIVVPGRMVNFVVQ